MKKFLLKLLMGASLTASVFVFQACYGTPPRDYDMPEGVAGVESVMQDGEAVPESQETEEAAGQD